MTQRLLQIQCILVGVAGLSLVLTIGGAWIELWNLALTSQFNDARQLVPREASLQSLRYLVLPATGLLIARRSAGLPLPPQTPPLWLAMDVVTLVALVVVSAFGARTILVAAIFGFLSMRTLDGKRSGRRALFLVVLGGLVVFSLLNWIRNAEFYRELGAETPVEAVMVEGVRYLSSPAQAQLAGGWTGEPNYSVINDPFAPLIPRIVRPEPVVGEDPMRYGSADVHPSLTTNSAVADVRLQYGAMALAALALGVAIASALASSALLSGNPTWWWFGGSICYGMSELWRTWLLFDSFFLLNLLASGAAAILTSERWLTRRSSSKFSAFA